MIDEIRIPIGGRIAAVSLDKETFLGYGVYLGLFHNRLIAEMTIHTLEVIMKALVPLSAEADQHAQDVAAAIESIRSGSHEITKRPKIRLDSGLEMWGIECYWGTAEGFVAHGLHIVYGVPEPA